MECIEVRCATETDLDFIRHVLADNDLPVADLTENLDGFYVFEAGEVAVGIGAVQHANGDGLLRSFVILEEYRGQGYGSRCCDHLIQRAEERSMDGLYLLTTDAAEFFSKMGFSKIDRSEVPQAIRNTRQFSELCPASAACLRLDL